MDSPKAQLSPDSTALIADSTPSPPRYDVVEAATRHTTADARLQRSETPTPLRTAQLTHHVPLSALLLTLRTSLCYRARSSSISTFAPPVPCLPPTRLLFSSPYAFSLASPPLRSVSPSSLVSPSPSSMAQPWEQIGEAFLRHYYQHFDGDRTQLLPLFVSRLSYPALVRVTAALLCPSLTAPSPPVVRLPLPPLCRRRRLC